MCDSSFCPYGGNIIHNAARFLLPVILVTRQQGRTYLCYLFMELQSSRGGFKVADAEHDRGKYFQTPFVTCVIVTSSISDPGHSFV